MAGGWLLQGGSGQASERLVELVRTGEDTLIISGGGKDGRARAWILDKGR